MSSHPYNFSHWKITSRFFPVLFLFKLYQVIAILDRIKDEKNNIDDEDMEQSELSDSPQDDRDWEEDDADEDIIYVQ